MVGLVLTQLNIPDNADSAQGMFIDRIGMIHIELGLTDNMAKFGDIPAQKAGLGHQGQGTVRRFPLDQNL